MLTLESVSFLTGLGTLALQIATILLVIVYTLRRKVVAFGEIAQVIKTHALAIALLFSSMAAGAAIFFSSGLGLEPCPLCWWQRIALFPQVILFAIALIRRDASVAYSAIALSIIGLGIALYQHALQMLPHSGLPCPATSVSCAQRVLFEFGYITFPLMAASIFAFIIALMLFARER